MVHLKDLFAISAAWNQARSTIVWTLHQAGYHDWCITIEPQRDPVDDGDAWTTHINREQRTAQFLIPIHTIEKMGFEEIARNILDQLEIDAAQHSDSG